MPPPQARLWFLHQLDPSDTAYNVCLAVELRGALNPHVLGAALSGVERRHAAFRSRFDVRSGRAAGTVCPPGPVALPIVRLEHGQDVTAVLGAFARHPFDLVLARPYRWCLVAVAEELHVLALVVHHIVFDGRSVTPLVSDLEALARASALGVPAAVPGGSRDSGARPNPSGGASDLDFWRSALSDLPPVAHVWPEPEVGDADPAVAVPTARWTLRSTSRRRAQELAHRHRSTVPAVLLACLAVVMHRYTGRTDVVIGVPVDLDDDSQEIGHRVNVLPVRVRIARHESFDAVLALAREALLEALGHRHTPFEEIVDVSRHFRAPGVAPLFQVLLTTVSRPAPPRFDGLDTRLLRVPTPAAKYELEITVSDGEDGAEVLLEADPRRCSPPLLEEFAEHFRTVVEAALSDPTTPVTRLTAVRAGGPRPTLARRRARQGGAPAGRERGMFDVVRPVVRAGADRTAVRAFDGQLSYGALDHRTRLVARSLQAVGAGPEQVVAVCVPRGLSLPVALLAVARTGAAPLPLDPEHPEERLRAMLDDSGAVALVGSRAALARCAFRGPTVCIEHGSVQAEPQDDGPAGGSLSGVPFPARSHPEQAAYVLATSGSTGRPKFVMMRREGFTALLDWTRAAYDDRDLGEVVALTSASFDLSVFELFAPLSTGGTVALVRSPGDLVGHPALRHATLLNTVPSVLETLLDLDLVPSTARCVNVAGEPLEGRLVARVLDRHPAVAVRNLYGPTEATTYVTATEPLGPDGTPTIGCGIAGVRLYVTDDDATTVPTGVLGELRIGGPLLARGYLGEPAMTAQVFVPDPAALDGSRVYRSGDIVRRTATGNLRFLGRRDHQVKILGVRVELGEVQAHLRVHAAVQEALVIVVGSGRERRLIGCVGAGAAAAELRGADLAAWLMARVPEAMTPREWIVLERLPLTPNGKVDRTRLAALPVAPASTEVVAPRSELEAAIARCWQSVLGRDAVGVHDVFFDAGGNSLTLLLLHAALQEQVDTGVRLVDLLRSPTIAAQADMVQERRGQGGASAFQVAGLSEGAARGSARRMVRARRSGRG
ncbi:non-ribosomal peptide synthetase [Goekera deserti]|uniref:non-ribosomal peptide synthetase n=1 Tax=Goekera deserti TaxID=2497753 RepID=UPI0022A7577F|nr:amino acid adenylation domain-containing protein [Goekera deserti]